jgi:hypothetical protein
MITGLLMFHGSHILPHAKEDVAVQHILNDTAPHFSRLEPQQKIASYRHLAEQALIVSGELTLRLNGSRKPSMAAEVLAPPKEIAAIWLAALQHLPPGDQKRRDTCRLLAEEVLLISGDCRRRMDAESIRLGMSVLQRRASA